MKAVYWQRGESLDYTNNTTKVIEAGTVLDLKSRIAVAGTSISPKETGEVRVAGVYKFKKADTGAVSFGTPVYYDPEADAITEDDSKTPAGYAAEESAAGADTILVKLQG